MENRNPPSGQDKGKGKGKSTEKEDGSDQPATAAATSSSEGPSVFARIAQSAAGLSRGAVAGQPAGSDLASLVSTDKAGPSRPPGSGYVSQRETGERALPAAVDTSGSGATNYFTSGHTQKHIAQQEEEFSRFLDSANVDTSIPPELLEGGSGDGLPSVTREGFPIASAAEGIDHHPPSSAVAEQERHDGMDVINILAGSVEEEPDYGDIELAEDEIAGLKRALFGDGASPDASVPPAGEWDNVLNFIPDFVRPNPDGYEDKNAAQGPLPKSHETRSALGMPNSPETTRLWLDQWRDVLTRYTNEVWGGLSPLVTQAQEEIDELQSSPDAPEPPSTKALNRLRQILGHLRGG